MYITEDCKILTYKKYVLANKLPTQFLLYFDVKKRRKEEKKGIVSVGLWRCEPSLVRAENERVVY